MRSQLNSGYPPPGYTVQNRQPRPLRSSHSPKPFSSVLLPAPPSGVLAPSEIVYRFPPFSQWTTECGPDQSRLSESTDVPWECHSWRAQWPYENMFPRDGWHRGHERSVQDKARLREAQGSTLPPAVSSGPLRRSFFRWWQRNRADSWQKSGGN